MSKRKLCFTLIRVIVVVAVIGAAVRLAAISFAPRSSAMSQQLNCPPDVVTHSETVVSPQGFNVTEQSATSVASGDGLANKSGVRSTTRKKEEQRSKAKKLATYAFVRNVVSAKPAAMGELAKHGGIDAKQAQKWKAPATMPPHSGISPSPFGDMHGQ